MPGRAMPIALAFSYASNMDLPDDFQDIGRKALDQLVREGRPATPENYARAFYALTGNAAAPAADASPCVEMLAMVRSMLADAAATTGRLRDDLEDRNQRLAQDANTLRSTRDRDEVLRLLALIVAQTEGIQHSVESSRRELAQARDALEAMQKELAEARQQLNEDPLTGVLNRRGLDLALSREIARAQRGGHKLCVAMLDSDHFKQVNDRFGHEAGDRVLVHFANLARSVIRQADALGRYGGEEFVMILPDTEARGALFVLNRLRMLLAKTPMMHAGAPLAYTFSAGLAQLQPDENAHALFARADQALYQAKQSGRNCIKQAN